MHAFRIPCQSHTYSGHRLQSPRALPQLPREAKRSRPREVGLDIGWKGFFCGIILGFGLETGLQGAGLCVLLLVVDFMRLNIGSGRRYYHSRETGELLCGVRVLVNDTLARAEGIYIFRVERQ